MLCRTGSAVPFTAICLSLAATLAHATHGNGQAPASYNGSLDPGVARTATLTDGYDWYCFAGRQGAQASVTVTTTSGDLVPNLELWSGTVANGQPYPYPGMKNDYGTNSENENASDLTVNYTLPTSYSGKYSVVVSTYFGETGDYSIALVGGEATSCEPVAAPVPALPHHWGNIFLVSLVGMTALFGLRRRPVIQGASDD
jgi:hypothetical protein